MRIVQCLILGLSVVGFLVHSVNADPGEPEKEAAAILYQAQLDVKVRRANELVWNPATNPMRLYDHDAIKTGERSNAIIQFNDETVLKIDEKSIIVILDTKKKLDGRESAIAVPSGGIQGSVSKNVDRPLELVVRTSKGWIKASSTGGGAKGTQFRASVNPAGALQVSSQAGEVKVLAQGKEKVIRENESISVSGNRNQPVPADNELPEYFSKLPAVNDPVFAAPAPKKAHTSVKPKVEKHKIEKPVEVVHEKKALPEKVPAKVPTNVEEKQENISAIEPKPTPTSMKIRVKVEDAAKPSLDSLPAPKLVNPNTGNGSSH